MARDEFHASAPEPSLPLLVVAWVPDPNQVAVEWVERSALRMVYRAAWPLFGVIVTTSMVFAHFGRSTAALHLLALSLVVMRVLPRLRANARRRGPAPVQLSVFPEELVLFVDGCVQRVALGSLTAVRRYAGSVALRFELDPKLVVVPERAVLVHEWQQLLGLARRHARGAKVDRTLAVLVAFLALTAVVGVLSWYEVVGS